MSKIQLLDHGYVEFIEHWGSDERIVEAARMSTDKGFEGWEKDQRLLKYLYEHKHSTPFEMCGMVVEVKAPIFVFREWQRHRTQSFSELSGRYVPVPNENYLPTLERLLMGANTVTTNKQAQNNGIVLDNIGAKTFLHLLEDLYEQAQQVYEYGIGVGVQKEVARLPVPVARYSKMRASANLRNWLAFLTLRMDPAAQWEIREYANVVGTLIEKNFPRTWELFEKGNKHE